MGSETQGQISTAICPGCQLKADVHATRIEWQRPGGLTTATHCSRMLFITSQMLSSRRGQSRYQYRPVIPSSESPPGTSEYLQHQTVQLVPTDHTNRLGNSVSLTVYELLVVYRAGVWPTYGPQATIRPIKNVKNYRSVSIRCVFSSSKIRQNSFSAGAPTWTPLGELTMLTIQL